MATLFSYVALVIAIGALTAVCTAFVRSRAGRRLAELLGFGDEPEWM